MHTTSRLAHTLLLALSFSAVCAAAQSAAPATDSAAVVTLPADDPDVVVEKAPAERKHRLPFLADEAIKRGYELPEPFGAGLIFTALGNRAIDVTDVRVGLQNPPGSVSDFVDLGSSSDVFNVNAKFDAFVLPFLNVYALVGYVKNHSSTHALITVPAPGPLPGSIQYEKDVETDLEGVVGGVGFALATGYKNFFFVLDTTFIQSDLGFDDRFKATIATVRAGYRGRIREMPLQMWLGAGSWDTAATAKGTVELDNGQTLTFEADQKPHTKWMYDVGTNLEISKKLQLVLDFGADFDGGYFFVAGPTYRF
jgi:hypothetical protein